jgi:hypothetical protein
MKPYITASPPIMALPISRNNNVIRPEIGPPYNAAIVKAIYLKSQSNPEL